jgi:hypothetical protein
MTLGTPDGRVIRSGNKRPLNKFWVVKDTVTSFGENTPYSLVPPINPTPQGNAYTI